MTLQEKYNKVAEEFANKKDALAIEFAKYQVGQNCTRYAGGVNGNIECKILEFNLDDEEKDDVIICYKVLDADGDEIDLVFEDDIVA